MNLILGGREVHIVLLEQLYASFMKPRPTSPTELKVLLKLVRSSNYRLEEIGCAFLAPSALVYFNRLSSHVFIKIRRLHIIHSITSFINKMALDSHMPPLPPHDKALSPKTKTTHSYHHHRHSSASSLLVLSSFHIFLHTTWKHGS